MERANQTLKVCLAKQKGGIEALAPPKNRLNLALFTLNFLTLDALGCTAADRHFSGKSAGHPQAMWKDILTGSWKGPDPVLIWGRASVCVFPQDQQQPIWVPERLVRIIHKKENITETQNDGDGGKPAVVSSS